MFILCHLEVLIDIPTCKSITVDITLLPQWYLDEVLTTL